MESWLEGLGILSPQAKGAAIQGLLTFLGVAITGGVAIYTWRLNRMKERQDREDARMEKREDLLRALWSDILLVWESLYLLGEFDDRMNGVRDAFKQAEERGEEFTPLVTQISGAVFLEALLEDLVLLKTDEIEPVVSFFHQINMLNQMASDMRADRFGSLSSRRKETMLCDLIKMDYRATILAENALKVLERKLNLPDSQRVDARKARLEPERQ